MRTPRRSSCQEGRSSATCRLLASLKTKLTRIPFLLPPLLSLLLMRFVAPFVGQAIASQTIVGRAIRGEEARSLWRRKSDRLIGEKPLNLVGTKEENRCRKSQVHLAFLLLIVNYSLSRRVAHRVK